jgi:hypothetical protein
MDNAVRNPRDVSGKPFAVLILGTSATGKDEWGVLTGIAHWDGSSLTVDCGPDKPAFPVPHNAIQRIKPVSENMREVLDGADFFVPLKIGILPVGADLKNYFATELTWPYWDAVDRSAPTPDTATETDAGPTTV